MKNTFDIPYIIKIKDKTYVIEYDHYAISMLEAAFNCGFYKIYRTVVKNKPLSNRQAINLLAVGAVKHHGIQGCCEIQDIYTDDSKLSQDVITRININFKNILPEFDWSDNFISSGERITMYPEFRSNAEKQGFYDFKNAFALAKQILGMSEDEFLKSSPRKLLFALDSTAEFNKKLKKHNEKMLKKDGIAFLHTMNEMLR